MQQVATGLEGQKVNSTVHEFLKTRMQSVDDAAKQDIVQPCQGNDDKISINNRELSRSLFQT